MDVAMAIGRLESAGNEPYSVTPTGVAVGAR